MGIWTSWLYNWLNYKEKKRNEPGPRVYSLLLRCSHNAAYSCPCLKVWASLSAIGFAVYATTAMTKATNAAWRNEWLYFTSFTNSTMTISWVSYQGEFLYIQDCTLPTLVHTYMHIHIYRAICMVLFFITTAWYSIVYNYLDKHHTCNI